MHARPHSRRRSGWYRFLFLLIACLWAVPVAAGEGKAAELEGLLRELRELRRLRHTEQQQARTERERHDRLLRQRRRRLRQQQERNAQARAQLDADRERLQQQSQRLDALQARTTAARDRRRESHARVTALLRQHPLLGTPAQRQAWLEAPPPADEAAVAFWNRLLSLATAAVTVERAREEITVGGERVSARVLRLGAVGAVWLTPDGTRGGAAAVEDGAVVWREWPSDELAPLVHAMKVVGNEIPAELVRLPVAAPVHEPADKGDRQ